MLVRFTPKQLKLLNNLLEFGKFYMSGREIQLFQEIKNAINDPIDEKQENNEHQKKINNLNHNITKSEESQNNTEEVQETEHQSKSEESADQTISSMNVADDKNNIIHEENKEDDSSLVEALDVYDSESDSENQQENTEETKTNISTPKVKVQSISTAENVPTPDELDQAGIFGTLHR